MLIYAGNLHKKNGAISQLGAEKITFPPKPDICFYRVALVLKIYSKSKMLRKMFKIDVAIALGLMPISQPKLLGFDSNTYPL